MSFWSDIGDFVTGIPGAIGGVLGTATGFLGNQLGNLFGPTLGRIGENFGKNIPTSFTINHKINDGNRIEVGVKVEGKIDVAIGVDVNVNLKDAIAAAQLLRDGLVRFDIFGGAIRQVTGDLVAVERTLPLLRELRNVVQNGVFEKQTDRYLFEISFVNDSTTINTNPARGPIGHYEVPQDCSCLLSIILNGQPIVAERELRIPQSTSLTPEPVRIDMEIIATNVLRGDAPNVLELSAKPIFNNPAGLQQLRGSLLQVRLLRRTRHWKYTVVEWIFDGNSGQSDSTLRFVVAHPSLSSFPQPSARANALAERITDLLSELSLPSLTRPPDGGAAPNNITALVHDTILGSYRARIGTARALSEAFSELEDEDPNTFDVRTPFYGAVSCHFGSVGIRLSCESVDANGTAFPVIENEVVINAGDEIAFLLPLQAGPEVQHDPLLNRRVRFILTGGPSGGRATATVYYGLEWSTRVLASRTFNLDLNVVGEQNVLIQLNDNLAD
jgi:hypothetical protein